MIGLFAGAFFLTLKIALEILGYGDNRQIPSSTRGRSGYAEKQPVTYTEQDESQNHESSATPRARDVSSDNEETQSEATVVEGESDTSDVHTRNPSTSSAADQLKQDIRDLKQSSADAFVRPPFLSAQIASKDISFLAYRQGPPSPSESDQPNFSLTLDGKSVPIYSSQLHSSSLAASDDKMMPAFMISCPGGFDNSVPSRFEISVA